MILILALLCALTIMSCKNEPGLAKRQQVISESTEEIRNMTFYASTDAARYELYFPYRGTETTLKVWTKDMMTGTWPEKPTIYTGSVSYRQYKRTLSETHWLWSCMYSISMKSVQSWDEEQDKFVNDPMYEPTVHVYDGVFDVSFVSGYNVEYSSFEYINSEYKTITDELVVKFEVSMNSDEAPSALIGVGNWSLQRPW